MIDHIGSTWTFFGLGVGGLIASSLIIYGWLRRTGLLERSRTQTSATWRLRGRAGLAMAAPGKRSERGSIPRLAQRSPGADNFIDGRSP
jgi:hypothetical protein